jgi:hypothetical protein
VLRLLALLAAMGMGGECAMAQIPFPTTTVQDTVYRADGTPAGGTVLVSWDAFTTAEGNAVPAGTTSATIGAGGVVTLSLAPNAGATPMGSYYSAVFHLNDGTISREFWVVPATVPGGAAVKLGAIRNEVLPASVAMQTVSKQYVDTAIARAQVGLTPADTTPYVLKAGDAMTGPLVLPGDPVSANQAADKSYVDSNVAAIAAGLAEKVSLVPAATQVVAQPSGTQLQVNNLNGELYASQYVTAPGNNGIANAESSPDCASGCTIQVEPTYVGEPVTTTSLPSQGLVEDRRGGAVTLTSVNPLGVGTNGSTAHSIAQIETTSAPQLSAQLGGPNAVNATALRVSTAALAGGSNLFPEHIESPPYFKNTYGVMYLQGQYYTQGQHVQATNEVDCYGVGDCLAGGQFIYSSGGYRDNADEGAHPFDLQVAEDFRVFAGTCASGCTTGATSLTLTPTRDGGTQGDGRFLIDLNPAKTISSGSIVSGSTALFGTVTFTGTSFTPSVFLQTAQAATSQPTNMAPGTVTLPLATSGVPSGFATSTVALPASTGIACVVDPEPISDPSPNYEMAPYNVVDTTHIQLTLNKPHFAGSTISVGGLCGYGLEQKADTVGAIRQVFPVVGSINATSLYYVDAQVNVVGTHDGGATGGFFAVSLPIASVARTAGVVTVTTAGGTGYDLTGLTVTISGVTDSSYNGTFAITSNGTNSFSYTSAGTNSTSTGGTLSFSNGSYALYPMAEVLSVYNPATKGVDGTFTLAPNTVAWAVGDAVKEPHYYKQLTSPDTELITQTVPRPLQFSTAGKTYLGTVGPGLRGWQIQNAAPASQYLGGGGTHTVPDDAYVARGPWNNDFEVDAGVTAVMRIHCSYLGCNRWDSGYRLFDMDTVVGEDWLAYTPQNSTATWALGGASYTFSPTAMTAATINVGTLNATTLTAGTLSANAISGPAVAPSGACANNGAWVFSKDGHATFCNAGTWLTKI